MVKEINKPAAGNEWSYARPKREPNSSKTEFAQPLRMAEPQPRQVPPAVTSGESIRRHQAKSPLLQVKEICLFYMRKCSGKYSDNKAAARYVHHMAEEIVQQLAGIAGEIRRNKGEPELYQALLDEWNENFPPSLGAMGSPKAIAALVSQQSSEILELKEALENERSRREKDVTDILKSMDAQLQAYKASVMSERQHQLIMEQQRQAEQAEAMNDLRTEHQNEMERMVRSHAQELKKVNEIARSRLDDANDTIAELNKQLDLTRELHSKEVTSLTEKQERRYGRLNDKHQQLKEQYQELISHFKDEFSALSSSIDEFDDEEESEDEDDRSLTPSLAELKAEKQAKKEMQRVEKEKKKAAHEAKVKKLFERIENSEIGKRVDSFDELGASSNAVEGKPGMDYAAQFTIRHLTGQINKLRAKEEESQGKISSLLRQIEELTSDLDVYHNRYTELEKLYEAVRRALSSSLDDAGILDTAAAGSIEAVPVILAHTPHFLGPADKAGLEANRLINQTAYNVAGHF